MIANYLKYISVIFAFLGVGASSFLHAQASLIISTDPDPLNNAVVGENFECQILPNEPVDEYIAYNLPSWLSLNAETGLITGTPEQSDLGAISIDLGAVQFDPLVFAPILTVTFNVVLENIPVTEPPVLTTVSTTGWVGQSFSYELEFSNQVDTVTLVGYNNFSGLTFNPTTRVLSGTPAIERSGKVYFQATNSEGTSISSIYLDIQGAPIINSPATHNGEMNTAITPYQITAENDVVSYSASGLELIPGISLSAGGLISGTPEVFGIYDVVLTAANPSGVLSKTLTLTINKEDGSAPIPEITSSLTLLLEHNQPFGGYQIEANGNPTSYSATGLPSGFTINNPVPGEITGTPSNSLGGVYLVQIAATNAAGSGTEELRVIIGSGVSPTVLIDNPADGTFYTAGDLITIDVTADDADGQVTAVNIFDGGTSIGSASKVALTTWRLTVPTSLSDVGLMELTARATDDSGNISITDAISITIDALINSAPSVDAVQVPTGKVILGNTVTLSVTAGDSDGSIASVSFYNGNNLLGAGALSTGNTYTLAWTPSVAGVYNMSAVAIDNAQLASSSSVVSLTVSPNAAPTAGNVQVVADEVPIGATVVLAASAGDTDGSIASVDFYNGGVLLGAGTLSYGNTYTLSFAPSASGTYDLSIVATDNNGLLATSAAPLQLTVVEDSFGIAFTDPTSGSLILSSDAGPVEQNFTVQISGNAGLSSTNFLQSVQWYYGDILIAESTITAGLMSYTQSYTPAKSGMLKVLVTNAWGFTSQAEVRVIVDYNSPLNSNEAFVRMIFNSTGQTITEEALADALAAITSGADVISARANWASALFNSAASGNTKTAMMVYRTMLGSWPNAAELAVAEAALYGATAGSGSKSGSTASGPQTYQFNYTANDDVLLRVFPDSSNGSAITYPTVRILDPSGNQVDYSVFSFATGSAESSFNATQSGTYSVIVGTLSNISFWAGDFVLTSVSSNSGNSTTANPEALVTALQDDYAVLNGTFPTSVTVSDLSGIALISQLFLNKHGESPSTFNLYRLRLLLTGSEYGGNAAAFAAAFATDNSLSGYQHPSGPLSSVLSYIVPNDPSANIPLALAVSVLLNLESSDALVASYSVSTLEFSIEQMLKDELFYNQYAQEGIGSFVASRMAALGVFDLGANAPEADADNDGQSNLFELALGSNPTNSSDTVPALTVVQDGADYLVSFLRLDPATAPADLTASINCSPDLEKWSAMDASVSSEQSNVPAGYIRYELRIQTESDPQCFIRTGVLE